MSGGEYAEDRAPKDRWLPFAVDLRYDELEEIVAALAETKRAPKLRKELEATKTAMWRNLP